MKNACMCTNLRQVSSFLLQEEMWMNVPLTMVGVLKYVPTRMDPLCVAVELDSPWPVMEEAAMVSKLITGYIL